MTRKAIVEEQPAGGGSYVRQKDGSLKREEGTETPPGGAPTRPDPAEERTAAPEGDEA